MKFSDIIRYILNFFDKFQQKKIINFFKQNINKSIIVFDVGAHHGETIKLFQNNFNIHEIHAFEASRKNFKKLIKLNYKKNVFLNNFGLSDNKRIVKMNILDESSSSTLCELNNKSKYLKRKAFILNPFSKKIGIEKEIVNLKTLNEYFIDRKLNHIDILKIDTEGHELQVLKGCQKIIKKIKFIYFEHHYDNMLKKEYSFRDINKFLKDYNFKMIFKSKMIFRKSFEYIYSK